MKKTKDILGTILVIPIIIGAVVFGIWIILFVAGFLFNIEKSIEALNANSFFKFFPIIYLVAIIYFTYLLWYVNMDMKNVNNCFKLKFKAFINFYEVSNNISVDKKYGKMYRPYYIRPKKIEENSFGYYNCIPSEYYQILFSFVDWIKFEIWLVNIKRQKKKKKIKKERKENNELVLSFLEQMKQDIEIHKQKAEEELQKAIDYLENVQNRS